jgi:hypothetical protein
LQKINQQNIKMAVILFKIKVVELKEAYLFFVFFKAMPKKITGLI